VLAYRSVAIWVPAPVGLAALGGLRRTVAAWGRADAPAGQVPATARAQHVLPRPVPAWPHSEPLLQAA
jgi:hypothetical protein